MTIDLIQYRAQLVARLKSVDDILHDLGTGPKVSPVAARPVSGTGMKLSSSAKAKISAAKKAWWAAKRKAEK